VSVRLTALFSFLNEADKLKQVLRATTLVDASRPEDSAEHSRHLALYAMVLADQAGCRNVPPERAARPKGRKRFRPCAPFASWQGPSATASRLGGETRCVSWSRQQGQSLAPDREGFPGRQVVGLLFNTLPGHRTAWYTTAYHPSQAAAFRL
jgi:hypothetical protein